MIQKNKNLLLFRSILLGATLVLAFMNTASAQLMSPNGHGIAEGEIKFLGNISSESNKCNCDSTSYVDRVWDYGNPVNILWNQVTPENSGKWGSVEGTKGTYNWAQMDLIFNNAVYFVNDLKLHTFVWGSQLPAWFYNSNLTQSQKVTAVDGWIKTNCEKIDGYATLLTGNKIMIDVVNEPINTPNVYQPEGPSGGGTQATYDKLNTAWKDFIAYKFPLKNYPNGTGTEYDWVVWSFEKAREYCPKASLLLNEFHVINNANAVRTENNSKKVLTEYKKIVKLLKDKDLIDGVGMQSHQFSIDSQIDTDSGLNGLIANLNDLATTGVPVYITELDITGCDIANDGKRTNCTEAKQKTRYERLFPKLWENKSVAGVTLWGAIEDEVWTKSDDTKKTATHLIKKNGTDTQAMAWLRSYFQTRRENGAALQSNFSYLKVMAQTREIEIRAMGATGQEKIRLIVNNQVVKSWTLTTAMKKYYVTTDLSGAIKVEFYNDATNRDVRVDYLSVNGVARQAENQPINTAAYQNNKCGGGAGKTEWMHCNGYINFRNL